jgi:hypothetical protein
LPIPKTTQFNSSVPKLISCLAGVPKLNFLFLTTVLYY